MPPYEFVANMHMHTPYSDGAWYHAQVAEAAAKAGLDGLIVTDHNIWVDGLEGYVEAAGRRVLMLVGEEVHDTTRQPQKNHLLVYGANGELSRCARDPQRLINAAASAGGLTFLAHPWDPPAPIFREFDLSWVSWDINGYTGLELWNYMTSFKALLTSRAAAVRYAFDPELGITEPFSELLRRWDALTTAGQRVVVIGNADAHGNEYRQGALRRVIFPYEFLFRQINTHLLLESAPTGDVAKDKPLVLQALARGNCFVGYDGAAPTRGFRFAANSDRGSVLMGDQVRNRNGLTLQFAVPAPARVRLLRNGQEAARWENQTHAAHIVPAGEGGVYRIEAHLKFRGRLRGWIYSNPIYVAPD